MRQEQPRLYFSSAPLTWEVIEVIILFCASLLMRQEQPCFSSSAPLRSKVIDGIILFFAVLVLTINVKKSSVSNLIPVKSQSQSMKKIGICTLAHGESNVLQLSFIFNHLKVGGGCACNWTTRATGEPASASLSSLRSFDSLTFGGILLRGSKRTWGLWR